MSSREERYYERQQLHAGEVEVSNQAYNLIIGGMLLYGFLVNCFMVAFCFDMAFNLIVVNPILFIVLYLVMCVAGSLMISHSSSPVISFIGYNLIVLPLGLILSILVTAYAGTFGSSIVTTAFAITAIVTIGMMVISSIFPAFFLSLGKTLFITLLLTVVIEVIMLIAGASLGIIDYIVVLIFCGYIGYDWARANACARTVNNAITSAAELYVDIINIFIRILSILGRANRN